MSAVYIAKRKTSTTLLAALMLILGSCGDGAESRGEGGVGRSDAEALDAAAAKLDRTDAEEYRKQIDPPKSPKQLTE